MTLRKNTINSNNNKDKKLGSNMPKTIPLESVKISLSLDVQDAHFQKTEVSPQYKKRKANVELYKQVDREASNYVKSKYEEARKKVIERRQKAEEVH